MEPIIYVGATNIYKATSATHVKCSTQGHMQMGWGVVTNEIAREILCYGLF